MTLLLNGYSAVIGVILMDVSEVEGRGGRACCIHLPGGSKDADKLLSMCRLSLHNQAVCIMLVVLRLANVALE